MPPGCRNPSFVAAAIGPSQRWIRSGSSSASAPSARPESRRKPAALCGLFPGTRPLWETSSSPHFSPTAGRSARKSDGGVEAHADFARAERCHPSDDFALSRRTGAFSNSRMILKQVWVGKGTEVGSELLSRGFRCGDGEGGGGGKGEGEALQGCAASKETRRASLSPSHP